MTEPARPGAPPGNAHALTHGGTSTAQIVRVARAQKRRFLAQNGLRAGELSGIARALLDNYARAQAKVELLDRHFAERGLLDEAGEPRAATKVYFTALNSARLALVRLEENLSKREGAGPSLADIHRSLGLIDADGKPIVDVEPEDEDDGDC